MTSPTTITQAQFLRDLKGGSIDPASLSDPTKAALTEAGVAQEELAAIAGKDGVISGSSEMSRLYAVVDRFDKNGSSTSFAATTAEGAPTPSGKLYDALKSEVAANRAMANGNLGTSSFKSRLGSDHGVIDTNHLSSRLHDAFTKAGVSEAELKAAAGADGQIKGDDFDRLHTLVDRTDGASDGVMTTKIKSADGTVSDSGPSDLLAALDEEIAANGLQPQYRAPGSAPAATQTPLTTSDAMVVPEDQRQTAVDLDVKGISQFSLYPDDAEKGAKACFQAATKQANDFNTAHFGKSSPKLNGPDQAIQMAFAEDGEGRVQVDPTQARIGREYIDECLDAGRPALVGVSYSDDTLNSDKMTDHFVTINARGYDDQGRLFYDFKDPGAAGRSGRFFVDEASGKLFREGDKQTNYVESADYEVTQVRTYQ